VRVRFALWFQEDKSIFVASFTTLCLRRDSKF
jgi:hypothetical protein